MKTLKSPMKSGSFTGHLELAQILHEVVGERIVIVQNQDHDAFKLADPPENESGNRGPTEGPAASEEKLQILKSKDLPGHGHHPRHPHHEQPGGWPAQRFRKCLVRTAGTHLLAGC